MADVEECLRDVIDPELGINVVDLGLLYGVEIGSSNEITLDMTLTSAACPLTDVIEEQARPGARSPFRRRTGAVGVAAAVGSGQDSPLKGVNSYEPWALTYKPEPSN